MQTPRKRSWYFAPLSCFWTRSGTVDPKTPTVSTSHGTVDPKTPTVSTNHSTIDPKTPTVPADHVLFLITTSGARLDIHFRFGSAQLYLDKKKKKKKMPHKFSVREDLIIHRNKTSSGSVYRMEEVF